jgi:hypothetical protein
MRKRIAWTDERCWDDWTGVAGVQGLLCWAIGSRPSGAGRHEGMVGTRHHRARDHMGRGGVGAFASHSRREEAAAVFDRAWRNRCIQRADDDEEEGSFARRSLSTAGNSSSTPCRIDRTGTAGSTRQRNALSPAHSSRHVRPLSKAHRCHTQMAKATRRRRGTRQNVESVQEIKEPAPSAVVFADTIAVVCFLVAAGALRVVAHRARQG